MTYKEAIEKIAALIRQYDDGEVTDVACIKGTIEILSAGEFITDNPPDEDE